MTQTNAASCIISQRKTVCLRLKLFCCFRFCLRKSAGSAGESAVSFVLIDWVLLCEYSPADYADYAERNAASCIIPQRKTGWVGGEFYVVLLFLGFVCVNLRDLRETLGFHLCNIDWVLLREYSPADSADYADECSKLYYFAEKDRLLEVKDVLLFVVCCLSA